MRNRRLLRSKLMLLSGIFLASCVQGGLSHAADRSTPVGEEAAIIGLFDEGRFAEAAGKINVLVEARLPKRPANKPDPVLDRLIGEIMGTGAPGIARQMLTRAAADPTTIDRPRYTLLLAHVDEALGDVGAAERGYRALLSAGDISARQRQQATLGLAQLLMTAHPEEAGQLLKGYLARPLDPKLRWEAELVAARVERLQGRVAEAQILLERASTDGWAAPLADVAIGRIALDRALVAGLAGDRESLIAMTGAVGNRQSAAIYDMGSDGETLPMCGIDGVTIDDFVVVEIVSDQWGRTRPNLIYASRPEVAPAFLKYQRSRRSGQRFPQAKSVLLRCSVAPQAQGQVLSEESPILEWAVARAIYPVLIDTDAGTGALVAGLVEREARYGANSLMLIPILAALALNQPEPANDLAGQERQLAYIERLQALLTANGAPPLTRFPGDVAAVSMKLLMRRLSEEEAIRQMEALLAALVRDPNLKSDQLIAFVGGQKRWDTTSSEFQAGLISQGLLVVSARLGKRDPRTLALALRLVRLKQQRGDNAGAKATQQAFELENDLCAGTYPAPSYRSSDIRPEDYPVDALAASMFGRDILEFALDSSGGAKDFRILVEYPPFIFQGKTLDRAPTIRYEPARRDGDAVGCRGAVQPVRWQVPYFGSYD